MNKQLPAILLGIVCVVLLVAYINTNNTVKELRAELAALTNQSAPAAADEDTTGTADQKSLAETTGDADEQVASEEPAAESGKDGGRRMMENMAKMMDNPTMNKVMEASQRGAVGALYTDLIEYLGLNAEETKYFMDLLMYRQMKQVDASMKMMSGSLSDEEREVLQEEMKQAAETVKEEMEKFLNSDEDYAEFEFYEKTMGERMMLSQMDKDLTGSGSELSDSTYRELLGIMHDERESFDFTSDLHDQENTDLSAERFSNDNVQNFARDVESLNDAIIEKAQAILTPEQFDAFVDSLKTFTEMQMAQLEMASQMFGGGE